MHLDGSKWCSRVRFPYPGGGYSTRPLSSVVEHLHGKEGVVSSILTVGSRHLILVPKLEVVPESDRHRDGSQRRFVGRPRQPER